ncbi:hypothetical protein FOVSG1_007882 [Fusarium oxysporum f. sp. vasinfectum]
MSQCFFHMTSVQIGPVHNKGTNSTTRTHYERGAKRNTRLRSPQPHSGSALRQRSADIQIAVRVEDGQFEELMNHDNS